VVSYFAAAMWSHTFDKSNGHITDCYVINLTKVHL